MGLLLVVLFVGFIVVAYLVNGWALLYLWEWFMVPLGLPPLTMAWAIGISIVIGFLTNHTMPQKDGEIDSNKALINVFLRPIMAFSVGYIVQLYL